MARLEAPLRRVREGPIGRLSSVPGYVPIAAVLAILSWPGLTLGAQPGFDGSWVGGLHMAMRSGLEFGDEITWTYGPLGFLAYPTLYYLPTSLLSLAALIAAYLAAVTVVAQGLFRAFGGLTAAALAFVVAPAVAIAGAFLPEFLCSLLVVACARSGLKDRGGLQARTAAALAALAALITLIKFGVGLAALAVLGVAVVVPLLTGEARTRRLLTAGSVLLAYPTSLVLLWVLAGQPLENIVPFIDQSADLVTGFADAMSLEDPERRWEYVAAIVSAALLGLFVLRVTKGHSQSARLLVGAVLGAFLLYAFREGFTRVPHSPLFFAPLVVVVTALAVHEHRKLWALAAIPPLVFAAVSLVSVTYSTLSADRFLAVFDPTRGPKALAGTIADVASAKRRDEIQQKNRLSLRAAYSLSDEVLDLLKGRTVHIDPSEAQVAWAYPELRWRPAPVFQTYAAYTADLDNVNANRLASSAGPDFILHQEAALDERVARWESPNYVLQIFCRYRQVSTTPQWAILGRGSNRCGRPVKVSRSRVGFGQTIPVPQGGTANEIVVARFADFDEPWSQHIRALLLKRKAVYARLGGRGDVRFVPGHAQNLHVMRVPECLGYDRVNFDTRPFTSLELHRGATSPQSPRRQAGAYTVSFFRISFDCRG